MERKRGFYLLQKKNEFNYKQAIVIDSSLGMSKGKTAVQTAHASILATEETRKRKKEWLKAWLREGQKKVVLKVSSLSELLGLQKQAEEARIPNALVSDAGLTELEPGTVTALGIGPAPSELIDKITGKLKLV